MNVDWPLTKTLTSPRRLSGTLLVEAVPVAPVGQGCVWVCGGQGQSSRHFLKISRHQRVL